MNDLCERLVQCIKSVVYCGEFLAALLVASSCVYYCTYMHFGGDDDEMEGPKHDGGKDQL